MCTLTWRAVREGGYDLFFNRDELNTRGAEEPPRLGKAAGLPFAAPRDGDHRLGILRPTRPAGLHCV